MYQSELVMAAVLKALAQRGFAWPEDGAKDKDSVAARRLAFAAMFRYTGMSRTAVAEVLISRCRVLGPREELPKKGEGG